VFTNALNAWAFADLASWAQNPLGEAFNLLNGVIQEVWSQTINFDLYRRREIVPRELAEVGVTLGPPTEPFGLPSRVQSALETLRAFGTASNIARAYMGLEIGRASCRGGGEVWGVAGSGKGRGCARG